MCEKFSTQVIFYFSYKDFMLATTLQLSKLQNYFFPSDFSCIIVIIMYLLSLVSVATRDSGVHDDSRSTVIKG